VARKNKKGTAYLGLFEDKDEVRILKAHLKEKKWSAKRYLRFLVRSDLKLNIKIKTLK
jgi:hypothetical protein